MLPTGKHLSKLCPGHTLPEQPPWKSQSAANASLQHIREKTKHLGPSLVSVDSTQGSTKTALERGFFSLSAARGAPRWKGTHLWLPRLAEHSPRRLPATSSDLSLWHPLRIPSRLAGRRGRGRAAGRSTDPPLLPTGTVPCTQVTALQSHFQPGTELPVKSASIYIRTLLKGV